MQAFNILDFKAENNDEIIMFSIFEDRCRAFFKAKNLQKFFQKNFLNGLGDTSSKIASFKLIFSTIYRF